MKSNLKKKKERIYFCIFTNNYSIYRLILDPMVMNLNVNMVLENAKQI